MSYRVIQWASGNVGTHALRAIIERNDLELVGLKVYSDDKIGVDAGSLVGHPDTGVIATANVDELLTIDADCVNYNALGTTTENPLGEPLDDLCRILAAGYNVTTTSIDHLVYPDFLRAEARARIDDACRAGGSSLFGSGINPGFTMDLLPVTMSRISRTIDWIYVRESLSMAEYTAEGVMRFMGFGQPEDAYSHLDAMHMDKDKSVFTASLLFVANAIGFTLDDVVYRRESAVAESPFDIAIGTVKPGEVAVQRIKFVGVANNREVLRNEFVWRISDDIRPDWGVGDKWTMHVEGDPTFDLECSAKTQLDAQRPTSLTVAMAGVNAIPAVCAAPPGLHSPLTLPVWGGGYLSA
jgi:2,4-diaminopentanoate dehydrogenase